MMKKLVLVLTLILLQVNAGDFSPSDVKQLEATLEHNIKSMNEEKLADYMEDIHPLSPAFSGTKAFLKRLFVTYDLKATHMGMKPLMIDEKYFILKGKQKTIKLAGNAPFQDNIVEAIHVYKKHKGKWLLWSSMILEVTPVK